MTTTVVLLAVLLGLVVPVRAHEQDRSSRSGYADPIAAKAGIDQRLNAQIPLDLTDFLTWRASGR